MVSRSPQLQRERRPTLQRIRWFRRQYSRLKTSKRRKRRMRTAWPKLSLAGTDTTPNLGLSACTPLAWTSYTGHNELARLAIPFVHGILCTSSPPLLVHHARPFALFFHHNHSHVHIHESTFTSNRCHLLFISLLLAVLVLFNVDLFGGVYTTPYVLVTS
ncbi:hypothetical protein BC629DRAFT_1734335, partial [Irpex lacteus]